MSHALTHILPARDSRARSTSLSMLRPPSTRPCNTHANTSPTSARCLTMTCRSSGHISPVKTRPSRFLLRQPFPAQFPLLRPCPRKVPTTSLASCHSESPYGGDPSVFSVITPTAVVRATSETPSPLPSPTRCVHHNMYPRRTCPPSTKHYYSPILVSFRHRWIPHNIQESHQRLQTVIKLSANHIFHLACAES